MLKPDRRFQFWLLILVCLAASGLSAQVYQTPQSDDQVGTGGMVAAIDPVTGELRQPTAKEAAALTMAQPRLARELKVTQTASGMVMIELDESFLDYLTVRIGDDGRLHTACARANQVDTILRLPVQTTPALEEK